jgi:hypothetical protein
MIKLLPLCTCLILFTACSTHYRLYEYDSANRSATGFASQQDSLEFSYNFNTGYHQMQIQVKNNTGRPCYINLEKSAFIVNGQSQPWLPDHVPIQAQNMTPTANEQAENLRAISLINGTLGVQRTVYPVPPATTATIKGVPMNGQPVGNEETLDYKTTLIPMESYKITIRSHQFTTQNTPQTIQTYIAYTLGDGPLLVRQDSFYLSGFYKAKGAGRDWMENKYANGHSLMSISTKAGAAGTVTGILVLGAVVIAALNEENSQQRN